MNFQIIVILIVFAGAVFYVGRTIYQSIAPKKGCGSNCKCGVDFSNVEQIKPGK